MSLRDAVAIIWRRRFVVLLIAAVGLVASLVLGQSFRASEPLYQADASLSLNFGEDPKSVVGLVHVAGQTSEIYDLVVQDLGGDVPGVVEIVALSDIGFIAIYATGQPDEVTAEQVVGSYARHIIGYATSNRTDARDGRLARLSARAESLEADLAALRLQSDALPEGEEDAIIDARIEGAANALAGVTREISDLAAQTDAELAPLSQVGEINVQPETVSVDPLGGASRAMLGLGLGLLLGAGLALALHRFDTRLFNRRDAESAYRLPVLAEIPRVPWRYRRPGRILVRAMPAAKASEAYRVLRTAIARARTVQLAERGPEAGSESHLGAVVLVTSVSAAVGKSTTVANLAVACVDAGSKVLVVSADLRQPSIHDYFGVDAAHPGLTDAAQEYRARPGAPVELSRYLRSTSVEGVSLLLHGSPVTSPGEALAGARQLIESARSRFDIIVVDTPPMLAGNDVDELLWSADLVVQVARAGRTTIEEGQWSDEMAQRRPADTCGLVLIGSSSELERRSAARRHGWKAQLASLLGRGVRPVLTQWDTSRPLEPVTAGSEAGETNEPLAGSMVPVAPDGTVSDGMVPVVPDGMVPVVPDGMVPVVPDGMVPVAPDGTVSDGMVPVAPDGSGPTDLPWRAPQAANDSVTAEHPTIRANEPSRSDTANKAGEATSRPPSVWWAPLRPERPDPSGTGDGSSSQDAGPPTTPGSWPTPVWTASVDAAPSGSQPDHHEDTNRTSHKDAKGTNGHHGPGGVNGSKLGWPPIVIDNPAVDNKAVDSPAVDSKAVDNKAVDNKADEPRGEETSLGASPAPTTSVRPAKPTMPTGAVPDPTEQPESGQVPGTPRIGTEAGGSGAVTDDGPPAAGEATTVVRPWVDQDLLAGLDDGLDDEDELGVGMVKLPSGRRPGDGDRSFST